jgi:hypothetical protein
MQRKGEEAETKRFREFVKAVKAEDLQEYTSSIPEDIKVPEKKEDDIVDLDQVSPNELIGALKNDE